MVEKGHNIRARNAELAKKFENVKDFKDTSMKAESFLGNLDLGEVEHVENIDSARLDEGMPPLSEKSKSILSENKKYVPYVIKDVCNTDNRLEIVNTTQAPWRWNCQLLITFPNATGGGTGWFIGPHTVMTAGHCVFDDRYGGWATSIEVIPGMRGLARPFGSQFAEDWVSVDGWTEAKDWQFDYGAIFLPNDSLGNSVGYFGFTVYNDAELAQNIVNVAGYPSDKPPGTQWFDSGRILRTETKKIYYMHDTVGGESGGACFKTQGAQRTAVGIHAYGGCPNSATRIDQSVYDNMMRWRNT